MIYSQHSTKTNTAQQVDTNSAGLPDRFAVAVNRRFVDKLRQGDARWAEFNDSFENLSLTVRQLMREIQQGHAFTSPHTHAHTLLPNGKRSAYRHSVNWISSQHLAIDHDDGDGRSLAELVQDEFIFTYGAVVYATPSSTPEAPRSRSLFILDRPIGDKGYYTRAAAALTWRFAGAADRACKDPARLYFGSKGCEMRYIGHVLPVAVLDALIAEFDAAMQAERSRRRTPAATTYSTPPLERVREALRYIPPQGDYRDWLTILMAVHSEFPGPDGIAVCEEWSPGYPGEIEHKFRSFDHKGGVGIGSLFKRAQDHGWQPTPPRTPPPPPPPPNSVRTESGATCLKSTPPPNRPAQPLPDCTPDTARALREALNTPAGRALLDPHFPTRTREVYLAALSVLLSTAVRKGGYAWRMDSATLGELLGKSKMSASRNLHALGRAGLVAYRHSAGVTRGSSADVTGVSSTDAPAMTVDLRPLVHALAPLADLADTRANVTRSPLSTSCNVYARFAGGGDFADVTMRVHPIYKGLYGRTLRSLSPAALNTLAHVATTGELQFTRRHLVDDLGLTPGSAAGATKVLAELGLADVEKEGRTNLYVIAPDWVQRLEALLPRMASFLALYRLRIRNVSDRIKYVDRDLRRLGVDPAKPQRDEPAAAAPLRERRAKLVGVQGKLIDGMHAADTAAQAGAPVAKPSPGVWYGTPPRRVRSPERAAERAGLQSVVVEDQVFARRMAILEAAAAKRQAVAA